MKTDKTPETLYGSLKKNIVFRISVGILLPAGLAAGLLFFIRCGSPVPCLFYKFTGLYCPGCGATRALEDLLHLRLIEAAGHNIFFTAALPFVSYYILKQYIAVVFGKDVLPHPEIPLKITNAAFILILLFMILRNIPAYPFSLLAP